MTEEHFEFAPPKDAGLFGVSPSPEDQVMTIIGVPWEPTASYGRGCSNTPAQIVPVSHQLDLFEPFLQRNFGERVGLELLEGPWQERNQECIHLAQPVREHSGDLTPSLIANQKRVNQMSRLLNESLQEKAQRYLAEGKKVAVLGGDHSAPLGSIRAHALAYPGMGLLHIDAHHDLRHAYQGFYYSHASIMYNVLAETHFAGPLVSVGIRDFSLEEKTFAESKAGKVVTHYDHQLQRALLSGTSWAALTETILDPLPKEVYVSFDIDGLDPQLCPHTGTPVPGGLSFPQACYLLESIVTSGRQLIGFDLCEVAPGLDDWDLNVGSRLLHKLSALSCGMDMA